MDPVHFDVAYRLDEYRAFAIEHGHHLRGRPPGSIGRAITSLFAAPAFLFKASRVGRCSFSIDASGIVRTSKLGKLRLPWTEVVAVHRYSPGLLIEKRGGGVPIPYRCLAPAQRESVEAFVRAWEGGP